MTDMGREEYFALDFSWHKMLSVCQMALRQCRIDTNVVLFIFHFEQLVMTQAESPGLLIIGRAIGNPAGAIRKAVQMLLEFSQRHALLHRLAVTHHVQVRLPKVDDALPLEILDVGVADG